MNSFKDFTEFSKITLLMNNDNYLSYNLPSLYQKMEYISSVFSSALQPMAHLPDIMFCLLILLSFLRKLFFQFYTRLNFL